LILQQLLNGLVLGIGYALTALGFSMIFGVLRVINFAHGNVYMIGALAGLSAAKWSGGNFYVAIVAAMVSGALIGLVLERLVFRPVRHMETFAGLLTSTGALFVLGIIGMLVWGASPISYDVNLPDIVWEFGNVTVYYMQIFMLAAGLLVMLALWWIVNKTHVGIAMRAASHDTATSQLMGIDVNRVTQFTLAISSAIAALAGVLVSAYYGLITVHVGFLAGIKAFTAAVVGGIGSIFGSLIGGLLLGLIEGLASGYISSSYRDAIAFAILVLVLLIRPNGLFGKTTTQKM
jgi:branched-chain amino acid transport system permease protein